MWPKKKIYVTLPSQFYHFVTKAFLEISTKLLHKFPFYGWSQSDEKVMEMWQVQISTHFLALHVWKFPPWKNSFIFDGKILMWEIDGFVNAANESVPHFDSWSLVTSMFHQLNDIKYAQAQLSNQLWFLLKSGLLVCLCSQWASSWLPCQPNKMSY